MEDMTWLLTLKLKVLVCHPDPSPTVFTSTPPPLYHLHTYVPAQFSTLDLLWLDHEQGPKVEYGPVENGEEEEVESRLEVKELVVPEQEVGEG